jgi:hypothetical protein
MEPRDAVMFSLPGLLTPCGHVLIIPGGPSPGAIPPMPDAEVALSTIIKSLEILEEPQRRNVLLYVNARYGAPVPGLRSVEQVAGSPVANEPDPRQFSDVGDLFDAASTQSEADQILVVAYWKQVVEGADAFGPLPVSKELKRLRHGVLNITRLISQSSKLVLQVAKSGKARQARKRYKVTREGVRRVQAMISGEGA